MAAEFKCARGACETFSSRAQQEHEYIDGGAWRMTHELDKEPEQLIAEACTARAIDGQAPEVCPLAGVCFKIALTGREIPDAA
jgi:hypothetical protein